MHIIITGGHSGIGLELSKQLLAEGHKIGLIVRSEQRKQAAITAFEDSSQIDFFIADLSKREHIQQVIEKITIDWPHIDVLFNNAGYLADKLRFSDHGIELQLEINAISPYLLTKGLLPLLRKAENPTVVSTATTGLHRKKAINIPAFRQPKKFTKLTGSYLDSKLVMVLLMNYLSKENESIRFVHVDPGPIKTKMTAGDGMPFWLKPLRNVLFKSPKEGAANLYKGAFSEKINGSGIYLSGGKAKALQLSLYENEVQQLL
ncbi:MAG: SDR family NAD(P)-dependent oxidoreductase, partial [Bacteroidota bacterium]